ncbi:glutamic acid-rich protein isoform X2 [Sitophilus oryzae]|uniref:Glutamic acid-rich protein isoform X2 n=1 Tax=Sitophilus oryzae TaxID=7048 RepID=A0A6J2X9M5_SITOR|nr:glutamic acid-rich protein isoform X2 [Sitophilus oryzae]
MPAGGTANSSNPSGRTTFRPPWVKNEPEAAPFNQMNLKSTPRKRETTPVDPAESNPIAKVQLRKVHRDSDDDDDIDLEELLLEEKDTVLEPVQLRKVKKPERESFRKEKENNPLAGVKLRKTSVQTKEPQQNGEEKESFFVKPQLKPVPQKEKTPPKKDHKIHDLPKLTSVTDRKLPERKPSLLRRESSDEVEIDREDRNLMKELPAKRNSLVRAESMRKASLTPAPPPMPPPPPGMPPPPPGMPGEMPKKAMTSKQKQRLDLLKARPKVRPDWSATLKEIEGGKKLKHVECNDRSQPLLPEAKAQEHFLYDSEKPNVHNELLKQIETGFKLKKVVTNDRSKPMLEGLRKFRRQMTIEEQIQKSMSMASIPPDEIAPEEVDEMDDIDKVRDDLQSTKQMLALELRNKEAQEMENKRLLARIANLEAELEKSKSGSGGGKSGGADDKVIKTLKKEAEDSRKNAEQVEKKYTEAVKNLDTTKLQLEEFKRKNVELEKKLLDAIGGKRVSISHSRQNSVANGNEDEDMEDESEEESDGEDTPEKREKRLQKEVKQLTNKLRNFKNKEDNAKKERLALKDIIKKHHASIKEEKKKYNKIKKEVDKMAALLKDVSEDEDDDEEKEEPEEEEEETEEEEESSEESDSESDDSDDSDSEKSLSEPEDAPCDKKKVNLSSRVKRHEARLGALKKGNFLLKTNAERLQDDLNKQKEMTESLQEDLNSVLSELG